MSGAGAAESSEPDVSGSAAASPGGDVSAGPASELEESAKTVVAEDSGSASPGKAGVSAESRDESVAGVDRAGSSNGLGRLLGSFGGGRRVSSAEVMIAVLLVLLGFTLVVQLKSTSTDPTVAATRQEDLVRILSDLEAREQRLRRDIAELEESQRQLTSGAEGRKAALDEATRRADELGILAGTLPAMGPGLGVRFVARSKPIRAATLLDAVQELRGAGAEAMQIAGSDGVTVRIVASTYFLDAAHGESGVVVDGRRVSGPYTITVIGDPATMRTALNIPGGVVASVSGDGGSVIVEDREVAEVLALHAPIDLKHAYPVS